MDKKSISWILVAFLIACIAISSVSFAENETLDKQKIVQRVAHNWVNVGKKQYEKGFYAQAEKSFLRALDYKDYLSADTLKQISNLLDKVKDAAAGDDGSAKVMQQANRLLAEGKLLDAQKLFKQLKEMPSLTDEKRKYINNMLKDIDKQIDKKKKDASSLYSSSVKMFDKGDYEKAREGFLKLSKEKLLETKKGQSPEEYLSKIDAILVQREGFPLENKKSQISEEEKGLLSNMASPDEKTLSDAKNNKSEPEISVITPLPQKDQKMSEQRLNIKQSYSRAVVKSAIEKADRLVKEGRFYHADKAIKKAFEALNENKSMIGESFFEESKKQLKLLSDIVVAKRGQWLGTDESQGEQNK